MIRILLDQGLPYSAVPFLRAVGWDAVRHAKEIDATLSRSIEEAQGLGFHGTPGFVIGRQVVPRSLNLPALLQLVGSARAAANGT